MIEKNKALKCLNLSGNDSFSDRGAQCVFVGLRHNNTLVDLNLRKTGITASDSDVCSSLTQMLQVNRSLKGLNLSGNSQFSDPGVCCIFEGLQDNNTLTHLRLKNMGIKPTPSTLCLLAELLKTSKSITYLNLSGNAIFSVEFAQRIFKSLQHNTTLLTLNLSRTAIDGMNYDKSRSSVASSFYRLLKRNKSLTNIKLSGNRYTSCYVSKIFIGLRYNTTLNHLDLSKMTITDEVIDDLADGLKSKYLIQTLDISGTLIGNACANQILDALAHQLNTSIKMLYISYIDPETIPDSIRDKIHLMP